MQRSLGTYSMRMIAKSGKSEKGQIAVNSGISKLILISLPGNSYAKVSSGKRFISSRGVDSFRSLCLFTGEGLFAAMVVTMLTDLPLMQQFQVSESSSW